MLAGGAEGDRVDDLHVLCQGVLIRKLEGIGDERGIDLGVLSLGEGRKGGGGKGEGAVG